MIYLGNKEGMGRRDDGAEVLRRRINEAADELDGTRDFVTVSDRVPTWEDAVEEFNRLEANELRQIALGRSSVSEVFKNIPVLDLSTINEEVEDMTGWRVARRLSAFGSELRVFDRIAENVGDISITGEKIKTPLHTWDYLLEGNVDYDRVMHISATSNHYMGRSITRLSHTTHVTKTGRVENHNVGAEVDYLVSLIEKGDGTSVPGLLARVAFAANEPMSVWSYFNEWPMNDNLRQQPHIEELHTTVKDLREKILGYAQRRLVEDALSILETDDKDESKQ